MGSVDFVVVGFGKTAGEAFDSLRRQALHDYGHNGYTGTIAEKAKYRIFNLPNNRNDYSLFLDHIFNVEIEPKKIPSKYRNWALKVARAVEDKYGPAGCFELTGKQAKDAKEIFGYKGKRVKAFVFFGWASI